MLRGGGAEHMVADRIGLRLSEGDSQTDTPDWTKRETEEGGVSHSKRAAIPTKFKCLIGCEDAVRH